MTRGPLRGPTRVNPTPSGGGGGSGIYAAADGAAISAYVGGIIGSSDDLTPAACWPFDTDAIDIIGAVELVASGSAALAASAHGQAAVIAPWPDDDADDVGGAWQTADATALAFTIEPWLFVVRVSINAAPPATRALLGRGSAASPHYMLGVDTSGQFFGRAKQMGAPTVATLTGGVADGAPRWVALYRTVTNQKLGVATAALGAAEAAFADTVNLSNGSAAVGLYDNLNSNSPPKGGIDSAVEHWLAWKGAAAETLIAELDTLLAGLEAAEG
ncbi:MAG TPA: hypothetical protein VHE35_20980 [Kofleriaceae bacterium]|nr:hypothetical protein [Kofleriaceae bacterium]